MRLRASLSNPISTATRDLRLRRRGPLDMPESDGRGVSRVGHRRSAAVAAAERPWQARAVPGAARHVAIAIAIASAVLISSFGVGTAAVAEAKLEPEPVCNLVTDPKDDTFLARPQETVGVFGPPEDAADVVSADVASNDKTITGVVRVKSLAAPARTAPVGVSYIIVLSTPSIANQAYLRAVVGGSGAPTAQAGTRQLAGATSTFVELGTGTVVVDPTKGEIRFSFPVALFESVGGLVPETKLTFVDVTSGRVLPPGDRALFADVASGGSTYTLGAPSCVKPGK